MKHFNLPTNEIPTAPKEKKFLVFWRGGEIEELSGTSISEAFNLAGYGSGAVSAVDFYSERKKEEFVPVLMSNGKFKWMEITFCELFPKSFVRNNAPITEGRFKNDFYFIKKDYLS